MRGTIALGALLLAVLAVAGCAVPVTTVPEPPHHTAVEVAVPHGDVVLAGTLTLPGGPGPHPAAVLVTGRGPHDRDETLGPHRPFRLLADTLARAGVAVLRTDDRGVGGSTGSLAGATYDDLVGDTLAAVALLRSRPDVDPARVGLIGHSGGPPGRPVASPSANPTGVTSTCATPIARAAGSTWNRVAEDANTTVCPARRCAATSRHASG